MDDEPLVTPCCDTEIDPVAGFQGVDCCGDHYSREDLENDG